MSISLAYGEQTPAGEPGSDVHRLLTLDAVERAMYSSPQKRGISFPASCAARPARDAAGVATGQPATRSFTRVTVQRPSRPCSSLTAAGATSMRQKADAGA
ncbi:MAG: hypothetical protein QOD55_2275, partial [Solirubrobacteraceae bacterium]|nr:hypothetical protein [Solirubrobacteraceae bacterium]